MVSTRSNRGTPVILPTSASSTSSESSARIRSGNRRTAKVVRQNHRQIDPNVVIPSSGNLLQSSSEFPNPEEVRRLDEHDRLARQQSSRSQVSSTGGTAVTTSTTTDDRHGNEDPVNNHREPPSNDAVVSSQDAVNRPPTNSRTSQSSNNASRSTQDAGDRPPVNSQVVNSSNNSVRPDRVNENRITDSSATQQPDAIESRREHRFYNDNGERRHVRPPLDTAPRPNMHLIPNNEDRIISTSSRPRNLLIQRGTTLYPMDNDEEVRYRNLEGDECKGCYDDDNPEDFGYQAPSRLLNAPIDINGANSRSNRTYRNDEDQPQRSHYDHPSMQRALRKRRADNQNNDRLSSFNGNPNDPEELNNDLTNRRNNHNTSSDNRRYISAGNGGQGGDGGDDDDDNGNNDPYDDISRNNHSNNPLDESASSRGTTRERRNQLRRQNELPAFKRRRMNQGNPQNIYMNSSACVITESTEARFTRTGGRSTTFSFETLYPMSIVPAFDNRSVDRTSYMNNQWKELTRISKNQKSQNTRNTFIYALDTYATKGISVRRFNTSLVTFLRVWENLYNLEADVDGMPLSTVTHEFLSSLAPDFFESYGRERSFVYIDVRDFANWAFQKVAERDHHAQWESGNFKLFDLQKQLSRADGTSIKSFCETISRFLDNTKYGFLSQTDGNYQKCIRNLFFRPHLNNIPRMKSALSQRVYQDAATKAKIYWIDHVLTHQAHYSPHMTRLTNTSNLYQEIMEVFEMRQQQRNQFEDIVDINTNQCYNFDLEGIALIFQDAGLDDLTPENKKRSSETSPSKNTTAKPHEKKDRSVNQLEKKSNTPKIKRYDDDVFKALASRKLFARSNKHFQRIMEKFQCSNCKQNGHVNVLCLDHQKPENLGKYKATIFKSFCNKIPEKTTQRFEEVFEAGNSLN